MKAAYISQLNVRKKAVDAAKSILEEWYAKKLTEEAIVDEERKRYDSFISAAETANLNACGTLNSIKKATASCLI